MGVLARLRHLSHIIRTSNIPPTRYVYGLILVSGSSTEPIVTFVECLSSLSQKVQVQLNIMCLVLELHQVVTCCKAHYGTEQDKGLLVVFYLPVSVPVPLTTVTDRWTDMKLFLNLL